MAAPDGISSLGRMTKRPAAIGSALLVLALLAGCAGAQDATPQQTQAAEGAAPDGEALLDSLADIDPALGDEASLDDADQVCLDIERGAEPATIEDNARELFGARAGAELTGEQAAEIVDAITTDYCG